MIRGLSIPGLDSTLVDRFGGSWDDGGLWVDVERLADAVFARQSDGQVGVAWHHLVLAVGNFKRQAGRRLYPASVGSWLPAGLSSSRPESLIVPVEHGSLLVGKLDEASWVELERSLRGAGVATLTTLLAALWPDEHVVFDWRVHAAANGLRLNAGLETTAGVRAESDRSAPITLDDYKTVRCWIVGQARQLDRPPSQVERALYRLSQDGKLKLAPNQRRSWREYGHLLSAALVSEESVPEASGEEGDAPRGS